jgi:hypothetical protein
MRDRAEDPKAIFILFIIIKRDVDIISLGRVFVLRFFEAHGGSFANVLSDMSAVAARSYQ